MVGVIVTATAGDGAPELAGVTVTAALADLVLSSVLMAVTVTERLVLTAGAVYNPLEVMMPSVLFPPVTPLTCHVTASSVVPVTVALNACVLFATRFAVVGTTEMETVSPDDVELGSGAVDVAGEEEVFPPQATRKLSPKNKHT